MIWHYQANDELWTSELLKTEQRLLYLRLSVYSGCDHLQDRVTSLERVCCSTRQHNFSALTGGEMFPKVVTFVLFPNVFTPQEVVNAVLWKLGLLQSVCTSHVYIQCGEQLSSLLVGDDWSNSNSESVFLPQHGQICGCRHWANKTW